MRNSSNPSDDKIVQSRALEAVIRIGLVVMLAWWCFNIVKPFILPVLWGAIVAVALYPLFRKLQSLLGGREKLTAIVMTTVALAILIVPTIMLSESLVTNTQRISARIEAGTLTIPPPSDKVKDWPLIGKKLDKTWRLASTNLDEVLDQFEPQLKAGGKKLLSFAAGAGAEVLKFALAIIIAGGLMVKARSGTLALEAIASRLMGPARGKEMVILTGATIRSVAQGVLGVALIQAVGAGIGLMVVGVPYTGLWTLAVLVLAIVQLPTILILGPIILYVFSIADTVSAVLFAIWSVIVGASDTFLKPLFLGRGLDIPMLVILLGAIGGMILSGIIGLFVGAVILAVGYRLFVAWLHPEDLPADGRVPDDG